MSLIFRLIIPLLFFLPRFACADYILYKSRAGVLVVSNNPGAYFSFDVPGHIITPADLDTSPYPRLFSDAFYLEIVPLLLEGRLPSNRNEELTILNREFEESKAACKGTPREIRSAPVPLNGKTTALTWSFIPPGETKRYYCLAFRSGKTLFLLKSGFAEASTKDDPGKFVVSVAKSYVRSETRMPPPK